mgnify:CR=1 FL=1
MATIGNLFINVIAKTRGLVTGLKGAKGMLGKFARFAASPAGIAVIAFGALVIAIKKVSQALKGAIKESMKFNHAMSEVRMIMFDASEQGGKNFDRLREKAIELGKSTMFTGSEVAQGFAMLQRAGFDTEESLSGIEAVLNIAASQTMEMGEAANIVAGTLRAFGLEANEAERVADVLGMTASRSKTNVQDMGEALKYVAPIAHSLGITLEETAAMVGILADSNIEGSMSGTSMRTMLLSMVNVIHEKGMPALREYLDAGHDIVKINEDFTKRAVNTVDILTKQTKSMDKLTGHINKATGAMKIMAKERLNDLTGDVIKMESAWSALQVAVGDTFTNSLRMLVQAIIAFLNGMMAAYLEMFGSNEEAIVGLNSLKNTFIVIGGVVILLASIIKFVYNLIAFGVNTVKTLILAAVAIVAGAIGGLILLIVKGLNAIGVTSDEFTKDFSDGFTIMMESLGGEALSAGMDAGNNVVEGLAAGVGISGSKGASAMYDAMYPSGVAAADGVADGVKTVVPKVQLTLDELEAMAWEGLGEKGQSAFNKLRDSVDGYIKAWNNQNLTKSMIEYNEAIAEGGITLTERMKDELAHLRDTGIAWENHFDIQKRTLQLIDDGTKQWEKYITPMERYETVLAEIEEISKTFTLTEEEKWKIVDGAMSTVIDRAESLKESLRSPLEVYIDDLKEIELLHDVGAISAETQTRAIEKLRKEALAGGDIDLLVHLGVNAAQIKKGFTEGLQTALGQVKIAGQVSKTEQLAQSSLAVQKKMEQINKVIQTNTSKTVSTLKGTIKTDVQWSGLQSVITSGVENATLNIPSQSMDYTEHLLEEVRAANWQELTELKTQTAIMSGGGGTPLT